MVSAQEIMFAAVFAATLIGLAVYFIRLSAVVAWRRVASPFFRAAVITSCTCLWSLCAVGFVEYCAGWARQVHHTHVSQVLRSASGVLLAVAVATFVISFAAGVIGFAESSLRRGRSI